MFFFYCGSGGTIEMSEYFMSSFLDCLFVPFRHNRTVLLMVFVCLHGALDFIVAVAAAVAMFRIAF